MVIPFDFKLDKAGEELRERITKKLNLLNQLRNDIAMDCAELERLRQDQWFAQQEERLT